MPDDPTNASSSRVLLTVFDDSLDARWTVADLGGYLGLGGDRSRGCRHHLRLALGVQPALLQSRSPLIELTDVELDVHLTFLAKHSGLEPPRTPPCAINGSADRAHTPPCMAILCVALLPAGGNEADVGPMAVPRVPRHTLIPACAIGPGRTDGWRRYALPVHNGHPSIQQILLSDGSIINEKSAGNVVLIDDLQFVSRVAPQHVTATFFNGPLPQSARAVAKLSTPLLPRSGTIRRSNGEAGFDPGAGSRPEVPGKCRYMSSDYRPQHLNPRVVRHCRMDGDHLRGRWLQNCDPADAPLRNRPDLYAYGSPIPRVYGKFDFRVCYRTSFWERERALQALSWTWRPYDCRLEPLDASAFDAWLGSRTILLIGDSLTAQLYYSLVLLLGDAVVKRVEHAAPRSNVTKNVTAQHADHGKGGSSMGSRRRRRSRASSSGDSGSDEGVGGTNAGGSGNNAARAPGAGSAAIGGSGGLKASAMCASGLADEGANTISEVQLSHGGRIIKVLGHYKYILELQAVGNLSRNVSWRPFLLGSDFVVLNIGHHYRQLDHNFSRYQLMVERVARSLASVLKPTAHIIVRTTNVGHRGCENATRPLQDRRAAWERLADQAGHAFEWVPRTEQGLWVPGKGNINSAAASRHDPFDWRAPALHEGAWARVFGASPSLAHRFALLNVSFLDGRPDGHVATSMRYSDESARKANWGGGLDCLHYCYPGEMLPKARKLGARFACLNAEPAHVLRVADSRQTRRACRLLGACAVQPAEIWPSASGSTKECFAAGWPLVWAHAVGRWPN